MAIKIAFANLKGGVGKTVSATSVASILEKKGYRVLMVDCDPQRNTTAVYRAVVDGVPTMYDIIFSGYTAEQCIQVTEFGHIIPNDVMLINVDGKITPSPNMYKYIKKALQPIEDKYDFILFDTPPYRGILLGNVLMTCRYIITPTECELFSIQGLYDFYETIREFQEDNDGLRILGLLKVKHKKNQKLTKDLEERILPEHAAKMDTKVFQTSIRESVKLKESVMLRTKITEYAPGSTVEVDYSAFVDELLEEVKKDGGNK
jgi:chromosome partitioning protein